MSIQVVITATIKPEEAAGFEAAYREVTRKVHGANGHLRDELLRDAADATRYCLIAEWENEELFHAWADDPGHIRQSAAMYPYWAETFERRIYQVRATLASALAEGSDVRAASLWAPRPARQLRQRYGKS